MALTVLEIKLVENKRKRNRKVMEHYHFARKCGFKAEAATLLMRSSYANILKEAARNPAMLQKRPHAMPKIPQPKKGGRPSPTTTATPKRQPLTHVEADKIPLAEPQAPIKKTSQPNPRPANRHVRLDKNTIDIGGF